MRRSGPSLQLVRGRPMRRCPHARQTAFSQPAAAPVAQRLEHRSLARARAAAQHDELAVHGPRRVRPRTEALVPALQRVHAQVRLREQPRHPTRTHAAALAVDEQVVARLQAGGQGVEERRLLRVENLDAALHRHVVPALLVERAHLCPLLVVKERKGDGARNVALLKLARSTHIEHKRCRCRQLTNQPRPRQEGLHVQLLSPALADSAALRAGVCRRVNEVRDPCGGWNGDSRA